MNLASINEQEGEELKVPTVRLLERVKRTLELLEKGRVVEKNAIKNGYVRDARSRGLGCWAMVQLDDGPVGQWPWHTLCPPVFALSRRAHYTVAHPSHNSFSPFPPFFALIRLFGKKTDKEYHFTDDDRIKTYVANIRAQIDVENLDMKQFKVSVERGMGGVVRFGGYVDRDIVNVPK